MVLANGSVTDGSVGVDAGHGADEGKREGWRGGGNAKRWMRGRAVREERRLAQHADCKHLPSGISPDESLLKL